jgi:hypothetical protein
LYAIFILVSLWMTRQQQQQSRQMYLQLIMLNMMLQLQQLGMLNMMPQLQHAATAHPWAAVRSADVGTGDSWREISGD